MSRLSSRSLALAAALLVGGCHITLVFDDGGQAVAGSDAGGGAGDAGGADSGPADAGPVDSGPADSGSLDAGKADAGSDAGTPDAGKADAGADAGPTDAGTPDAGRADAGADAGVDAGSGPIHLDSATAQVSGRRGEDLTVTLAGHDSSRRIAAVMVRVADSSGAPIAGFDSHQSGLLDSDIGPATPAMPTGGLAAISTTATVEGIVGRLALAPGAPVVGRVLVSLRDEQGGSSNEVAAQVASQPVRNGGEGCDPASLADRCSAGLGCAGTPPTCQGLGPEITQLAYLRGDGGPTILMAGTAQGDELASVHIDFEDSAGNSINVVVDPGPPVVTASGADITTNGATFNGVFAVSKQQAPGFDLLCPQIGVTPTDKASHSGTTKHALPANLVTRAAGATCDLLGFNACAAGTVCTPNAAPAAPTCQSLAAVQTARCAAAVTLAPTAAQPAQTFGHTAAPSLWDSPRGCSGTNPTGRPEGVVKLVLAQPAAILTLSLDNPGTDFDTTMYLMPGCPTSSASAIACDDDNGIIGVSSVILLENVPAGTYTVVIDSFRPHGGNYQLSATVQ
jgi:hypothetical protein